MSKTNYYLAADASYGKQYKSNPFLEGLSVVSNKPIEFDTILSGYSGVEIVFII